MMDDVALLRRFATQRSEDAFAELVRRHLNLVYFAALRQTNGVDAIAEDATQATFTLLAQKACSLLKHPNLAGWLHTTACNLARDLMRAEQRRHQREQEAQAMQEITASGANDEAWAQVRPIVDDALQDLAPDDREAVLLRFFENRPFAEVGETLHLGENAARMRVIRALEQLEAALARRGVKSTATALASVLTIPAMMAAPAGVASSITATALGAAHASGGASFIATLLMSKLTAPALTAVIAAGLTAIIWTSLAKDLRPELAVLRAENERLTQATAGDAPAASVVGVANEYTNASTAVAQAMQQRQASRHVAPASASSNTAQSAVTARGHRNTGLATAQDAAMTFAWACDVCDPAAFANLIYFDDNARAKALKVLASMPESIRAQYRTPEELIGLFLAAACLEAPPPGADLMERLMVVVELSPGRVATRRRGSTRNTHEYQKTSDGWKWVVPERAIESMPGVLSSETLARLGKQ